VYLKGRRQNGKQNFDLDFDELVSEAVVCTEVTQDRFE
jgi:hypothetical protein